MSDQHILISTYGLQFGWHAYVARRNPSSTDYEEDIQGGANQLAKLIEEHDTGWMPLVMSTKLTSETAKDIREMLSEKCPAFADRPWQKYINREENFFFAIVSLGLDDPDNETLMKIH